MSVYVVFEHDGSLGPRETEYLGPFESATAAHAHCTVWGGLHGEVLEVEQPPSDAIVYSPEQHMRYQQHRL